MIIAAVHHTGTTDSGSLIEKDPWASAVAHDVTVASLDLWFVYAVYGSKIVWRQWNIRHVVLWVDDVR